MKVKSLIFLSALGLGFLPSKAHAFRDVQIKERRPFKKVIRTRMPPALFQEWIQKEFKNWESKWQTSWQTFVVDDQADDQYFVIARTADRPWAFGVERQDCEKPDNFEDLIAQVQRGGTPVHLDCIVSIKKERSFFRYQVTVYEPMYPFWKNPCYAWSLPPGTSRDPFYSVNYNMSAYAQNLRERVYTLVGRASGWRPPKKAKKIAAMKGPGQELIGGEAELLTDEEKKLSIEEQEKEEKQKKKGKK